MTVKELIKLLEKCDQEKRVYSLDCVWDGAESSLTTVEEVEYGVQIY